MQNRTHVALTRGAPVSVRLFEIPDRRNCRRTGRHFDSSGEILVWCDTRTYATIDPHLVTYGLCTITGDPNILTPAFSVPFLMIGA